MREFDLFVPLFYNDSSAIEVRKHQELQRFLLERFEGVTFFPQPSEGLWKRVYTSQGKAARRFLSRLKEQLKQKFKQEEILIVERKVGLL